MRRVGEVKKAPKRIRELVLAGGGLKHTLMDERLRRRDEPPEMRFGQPVPKKPEPETRLCPTCSMHVTEGEATCCLLCEPFPITELPITTTGRPYWWNEVGA